MDALHKVMMVLVCAVLLNVSILLTVVTVIVIGDL